LKILRTKKKGEGEEQSFCKKNQKKGVFNSGAVAPPRLVGHRVGIHSGHPLLAGKDAEREGEKRASLSRRYREIRKC
jgi:hypothetical protein